MRNETRLFSLAGILLFATWAAPSSAELLFHQGFETCWVPSQTRSQFLESIRTSIDGTSSCIPAQSGNQSGVSYTVCNAPNGCGSGVAGCPVSISAGTFTGNFLAGQFSGPGSVSDITVPVTTSVLGSCSIGLNAIGLGYTLDYLMQADGIDGVYSDDLMPPVVEIVSYTPENINCNAALYSLILGYVGSAIEAAEVNASAAIEPALRTNTLGQSVCPLSSP